MAGWAAELTPAMLSQKLLPHRPREYRSVLFRPQQEQLSLGATPSSVIAGLVLRLQHVPSPLDFPIIPKCNRRDGASVLLHLPFSPEFSEQLYRDPAAGAVVEGALMPWNGRRDVLIDRFDARAVLDMVPLSPKVIACCCGRRCWCCRRYLCGWRAHECGLELFPIPPPSALRRPSTGVYDQQQFG